MSQPPAADANARPAAPPPASRGAIVDRYFMEHRAKLLDLAAFLDRVDRAQPAEGEPSEDPRITELRRALVLLDDGQPDRARRILEYFSDPTTEPIDHASIQGAVGVATVTSVGITR